MIRRINGAFRKRQSSTIICEDTIYTNTPARGYAQYTTGATALDKVPPMFPPTLDHVSLLSFSVTGRIAVVAQPGMTSYGKLGRIVTGLTQEGSETTDSGGVQPILPLPEDSALIADLWNPANDNLPVLISAASDRAGTLVNVTHTLPSPIPIFQGTTLLIGLWMLPSLSKCDSVADATTWPLWVLAANYSLIYDDG